MPDPATIVAVFAPQLGDLAVEELRVGVLDAQLCEERVFATTGVLDRVSLHPREVILPCDSPRPQRPSGDPMPSSQERKLTERFAAAGHLLNIRVADHVITGGDRYVSFRTEDWL